MTSYSKTKNLSTDDLGTLLFLVAMIFGVWFRLFPPYTAGFPINDGGLFHEMITAIQDNDYRLPEYVQYNGLNIPFAYPPLAFYLTGLISDILNITLLEALLWLPAITLIAIIPAVFYLSNLLLKSRFKAGLATLLYTLLPRSLTWLIMGGGITRSLGQLFLILAIISIYLIFTSKLKKYLIPTIVFSTLACLTHLEAALHTAGIALVLWFFYGRNKDGVINSVIVAIGTLLLTAPWWITILLRFGIDPYLSAAKTGFHSANYLIVLLVPFSGEPFMTIIALLAVIGFAAQIARGEFLLPLLYISPFLLEPRNAINVSLIFMGFLASIAVAEVILPSLAKIEGEIRNVEFRGIFQSRAEKILCTYLVICLLAGMQFVELEFRENRVSPAQREVFEWITQNTPTEGRFLIITGETDLFADYINEWFPVLTDRVSLTTIQGYEWMGGGLFATNVESIQGLQQCPTKANALDCIESITKKVNLEYDYIYVPETGGSAAWGNNLLQQLKDRKTYSPVYEKENISIFRYDQ